MSRHFLKFLKNFGNGDVTPRRDKGASGWKALSRAFVEATVPAETLRIFPGDTLAATGIALTIIVPPWPNHDGMQAGAKTNH